MKIVLGSKNQGKLREMQKTLEHMHIEFIPENELSVPSVAETGLSFVENALIKARHAAKHTDLPALADDSGLCVDALGGAPGIFSARYAGTGTTSSANIKKLLTAISSLKGEDRRARFYCAIVFVRHYHDPIPIICQAQWEGRILEEAVGEQGFGYDPVFYVPNLNASAAQLTGEQKNSISHRAKALEAFKKELLIAYPELSSNG